MTKVENNSKIFVRLYVAKEMNLKIDENESRGVARASVAAIFRSWRCGITQYAFIADCPAPAT
ncbi:hypothetical protein [Paraburkholderia youngii]